MNKVYEINVLGYRLTISTEKDEQYVKELSSYLTKKIKTMRRGSQAVANMDLLILTSLSLVDEIKLKDKDLEVTRGRVERLNRLLDEKLSSMQV